MGRSKRKRKKKQASARQKQAAKAPQPPSPPTPMAPQASSPAPAPVAPRVQVLDVRSEDGPYPELLDKDTQDPMSIPYDKGGVPLYLLLLYLAFLALAGLYLTRNLFPDYLRYFGGD